MFSTPAMIRLAILLTLVCCTAFAQEAKTKTCRILFLDRPASAPPSLHLFDGSASREVDLPGLNFSQIYELPPGNLSLALLPTPPQDPENLPPGAPTVRVPEEVVDFYLIVTSDPRNQVTPVRMTVVNANEDQLRRGQTLWFNLTDLTIGGNLGSQSLLIQPQSRAIMDAPADGSVDYPVSLAYKKADSEDLYPIFETRWIHDPGSRNLGFVFAREDNSAPSVQVFPDHRDGQ